MTLERMGCFHQTRLSFMRALLRQLKRDNWTFKRTLWQVDAQGVGVAVYQACGPQHTYSLVCFANDLPAEKRSDRVIAEEWDATFALFDGEPSPQDIERMRQNVPRQEAGQCSQNELVLSRANRSVRLFEHVVDRLAEGQQPDISLIQQVGYLMRTTAVYGNGKFGLGDRERIAGRAEFAGAFRTELLAVWLIRWFSVDIVEHAARMRNPGKAVSMDPVIRARLGIGNSTGLGMAPFLVTHPALLHSWIEARETALCRVRQLPRATPQAIEKFGQTLEGMVAVIGSWNTSDPRQSARLEGLRQDIVSISQQLAKNVLNGHYPWDALVQWSATDLSMEGQELLVSMVIEPYGELVDDLADSMAVDESPYYAIDGSMSSSRTLEQITQQYGWALKTDFTDRQQNARFWYVSEEKLEPRLGERFQEPGADKEQPLAFARDMVNLHDALVALDNEQSMATFLLRYPIHRGAVRRLQLAARLQYAEIRDNLISAEMVPVDLLRCKLSFFGANKFDPRSDRWVRITMYQGAPFPDEFGQVEPDSWVFKGSLS